MVSIQICGDIRARDTLFTISINDSSLPWKDYGVSVLLWQGERGELGDLVARCAHQVTFKRRLSSVGAKLNSHRVPYSPTPPWVSFSWGWLGRTRRVVWARVVKRDGSICR